MFSKGILLSLNVPALHRCILINHIQLHGNQMHSKLERGMMPVAGQEKTLRLLAADIIIRPIWLYQMKLSKINHLDLLIMATSSRCQWLTPAILATWEFEIKRIMV
jgi:hypothetical protein